MPYTFDDTVHESDNRDGWSITCDLPITRRKTFHVVTDRTGQPRYKSRLITDCARFLADNGIAAYMLHYPTEDDLPSCRVLSEQKAD